MDQKNRELWLQKAIQVGLKRVFKRSGYKFPTVKVSVGLPYGRGGKKAIGQHWAPEASDDRKGSIFISPRIDDSIEVLGTLAHELVHASVGNKAGHGSAFKRIAIEIGLVGPMRATVAGEVLIRDLKEIIKRLGPYPHKKLNIKMNPIKKQGTRMIKMECEECGYIARASRKAILSSGPVICPCNGEAMTPDKKLFKED